MRFCCVKNMGTRRKSREGALQFLFQEDFALEDVKKAEDFESRFEQFCVLYQVNRKARSYMQRLLMGIIDKQEQVDNLIRESATNWRLERIAATDRSLLRIGVYEMAFCDDVPAQVAINEAVEIAKRFASDESPAFINGILDAVAKKNPSSQ